MTEKAKVGPITTRFISCDGRHPMEAKSAEVGFGRYMSPLILREIVEYFCNSICHECLQQMSRCLEPVKNDGGVSPCIDSSCRNMKHTADMT